jgi:hypothetical protein
MNEVAGSFGRPSLFEASVSVRLRRVVSETSAFHPNCAMPRHAVRFQHGPQIPTERRRFADDSTSRGHYDAADENETTIAIVTGSTSGIGLGMRRRSPPKARTCW